MVNQPRFAVCAASDNRQRSLAGYVTQQRSNDSFWPTSARWSPFVDSSLMSVARRSLTDPFLPVASVRFGGIHILGVAAKTVTVRADSMR
jgi:hypothetical protein